MAFAPIQYGQETDTDTAKQALMDHYNTSYTELKKAYTESGTKCDHTTCALNQLADAHHTEDILIEGNDGITAKDAAVHFICSKANDFRNTAVEIYQEGQEKIAEADAFLAELQGGIEFFSRRLKENHHVAALQNSSLPVQKQANKEKEAAFTALKEVLGAHAALGGLTRTFKDRRETFCAELLVLCNRLDGRHGATGYTEPVARTVPEGEQPEFGPLYPEEEWEELSSTASDTPRSRNSEDEAPSGGEQPPSHPQSPLPEGKQPPQSPPASDGQDDTQEAVSPRSTEGEQAPQAPPAQSPSPSKDDKDPGTSPPPEESAKPADATHQKATSPKEKSAQGAQGGGKKQPSKSPNGAAGHGNGGKSRSGDSKRSTAAGTHARRT
ncbi:MAG: hypothetical protein S4CHLAM102_03660 [Chlamydiia bacterium]|nr:hypothetical protein [Chlamydiia bacterium]